MKKQWLLISSILLFNTTVFANEISLVSVSTNGEPGNLFSFDPSISDDGRFAVFASSSDNLVVGDTNNSMDIFVHDRLNGATERVSISTSGEQANAGSFKPTVSGDGRFVVFESGATNLISNDTNPQRDLFIHDRQIGTTELVILSSSGVQANSSTDTSKISQDGRFIVFQSSATNLGPVDVNSWDDVYLHDRQTGMTELVSVSTSGVQANTDSLLGSVSADGRYVVFQSIADNLVEGDNNNSSDIFIRDRLTGTTELVSVTASGVQGNDNSEVPSVSDNGRFVAFQSNANNLTPNVITFGEDILVKDRQTGTIEMVSVSSTGEPASSGASTPSISPDGRFVVFDSISVNLVEGDSNGGDVFIHDRNSGQTNRVSVSATGQQGDGDSSDISISADSRFVTFYSGATNLDGGTTGIFVAENPFLNSNSELIIVEKKINNSVRELQQDAAQLVTGTEYRQVYVVTNNSTDRLYQVNVFEDGNLVCNFYGLIPGETKQRCGSYQTIEDGEQQADITVAAKIAGTAESIANTTNAYYFGWSNGISSLSVTHRINDVSADTVNTALTLNTAEADILFEVENTGDVELYRVKAYHDPVNPVNSGWEELCLIGVLKPGQVRYCKRPRAFNHSGLNLAQGRAQGANAIISPTAIINASNPTYFNAP